MKKTPSSTTFKVDQCRVCLGTKFSQWLNLGSQPLANALLVSEDQTETFYPLNVVYCKSCGLVQLDTVVDPTVLFDDYVYYSSTSEVFIEHFESLAFSEFAIGNVKKGDLVVDIGSNDGILLRPFKQKGAKVLGIEPCTEIARYAEKRGIETINEYFGPALADSILEGYGPASLVTMTNVFAHVDALELILDGVKKLIGDKGRFMIELPYLPEMLKKGTFDLIYHEHLSYFTLSTIKQILERFGLMVISLQFVPVHGGSIRVFAGKQGMHAVDSRYIKSILKKEESVSYAKLFHSFPQKVKAKKKEIVALIQKIAKKKSGNRIVGYGAPAKSSTMLNYFGIDKRHIDFIVDDAPAKQYRWHPGTGIYIVPPPKKMNDVADYIVLFAWNFQKSIINKLFGQGYTGKFIVPFPKARIV